MKHLGSLVGVCLSAALLAACGGSSFSSSTAAPVAPQVATPQSAAGVASRLEASLVRQPPTGSNYRVLHSFGAGTDGKKPAANLTVVKGTLYGTTYGGGAMGVGTVFRVSTAGREHVLHSFKYSDGARPDGKLKFLNGTLYGTTATGGAHGLGTVFSINIAGEARVLHSFKGGSDGTNPEAGLAVLNGTLYGTTYAGGSSQCYGAGCGTVFDVTTSGHERTLYSFGGSSYDGENPQASLTPLNGTFYGTTYAGGIFYGTVFAVNAAGVESVLYKFQGGADGFEPQASLTVLNGALYGTTYWGGGSGCYGTGCGTVFEVSTSGQESVLYAFRGGINSGGDGAYPEADLTVMNGTLYGTTFYGGSNGDGTVFSVTTSGQERVLYSFKGGSDGELPAAGLTALNGVLYGTTLYGGSGSCPSRNGTSGCGTVFALTP